MLKEFSLAAAALAMGATAMVPATASAQRYHGDRYERAYGNAYQDGYNRNGYDDRYDRRGYDNRTYRGDRGRYRNQRCNSGTTGTIIGAIAGGLLGRSIDSRGDRATGTILGAGGGALAGRAIGKSNNPRYCR